MLYQLKVILKDTDPFVWRRVQVPETVSLFELHRILQIVMGWRDQHPHQFTVAGASYGQPDPGGTIRDERKTGLAEVAREGTRFIYDYDLGNTWRHEVVVDKVTNAKGSTACLGGARACPPENCGGPRGYLRMLQVLKDPRNPEYARVIKFLGGAFDAETFDLDEVNDLIREEAKATTAIRPLRL
jgi:hypothetical protein